jgi:hypothetical protein
VSNSNSTVVVLIIGSLLCAASVNVYSVMDLIAQGANNQSLNATGAAAQNMTTEDSVTPDLSNFTSETGTITAQSGTVSSCPVDLACVKVSSYCNILSPLSSTTKMSVSCNPIINELFRIFPYLYRNNELIHFGPDDGIEASSSGKMITFPVIANTSVMYVIRQDLSFSNRSPIGDLFHIFQSGSGCTGEIKAGETKNCWIFSDLYVKTSAG